MHFLFLFFFYNLFRCTWWKPGPTKGKGKTTADFSSTKIHLNWLCLKVRYLVQDNHLGSFYSPCRKVLAPPASIHPPVSDSYLGMGWDEWPSVGAVSLSTDCGGGWNFEIIHKFRVTIFFLSVTGMTSCDVVALPHPGWRMPTCCNTADVFLAGANLQCDWPQVFLCKHCSGGLGLCLALATCQPHCIKSWQISEAAAEVCVCVYIKNIYAEQCFAGFCQGKNWSRKLECGFQVLLFSVEKLDTIKWHEQLSKNIFFPAMSANGAFSPLLSKGRQ